MSHPVLDTNILVRLLTGEPENQAKAVVAFFQQIENENRAVELPPLIVAETIYVLQSFYKVPKAEIAPKLAYLIESPHIICTEKETVHTALSLYEKGSMGFQDAYVAARAMANNVPVVSFDKGFDKIKGLSRIDPIDSAASAE